jgi:vancomycin aglycone glucosyltransferase
VIVGAGVHQYAVRSIAERNGIPSIVAAYAPVSIPTPDLPPPGAAEEIDDAAANLRRWDETRRAWNQRALERVNANRLRLGLPMVEDVLGHIVGERAWLAADPMLAPAPATPGVRVAQTGAWILEDSQPLDPDLEAFLRSGGPPVYVGLGSMPAPEGTSRALVDGVRALRRRVILSQGWADLEAIDGGPDCLVVGDTNQQALFPRVAAVVHHGGAGTTTAAARAGVPQIALPMFSDQFYWARRLRDLGIGAAVPFGLLAGESLASALRDVLRPSVIDRARLVSTGIVHDGAATAARQLAELVSELRQSQSSSA